VEDHGNAKQVEGILVNEDEAETRQQLERLAWLLDDSIRLPGLKMRIGVDSVLGLIPGVGDVVAAVLSTYILAQASRLGVSKAVLLRMSGNVVIDTVVGAIPLLGDLFDAGFKSNRRNVALLAKYLDEPRKVQRTSWMIVIGLALVLLVFFVGAFYLIGLLFAAILGLFATQPS
jgi:hypothetical protein